jgi:hypothetical protein
VVPTIPFETESVRPVVTASVAPAVPPGNESVMARAPIGAGGTKKEHPNAPVGDDTPEHKEA